MHMYQTLKLGMYIVLQTTIKIIQYQLLCNSSSDIIYDVSDARSHKTWPKWEYPMLLPYVLACC